MTSSGAGLPYDLPDEKSKNIPFSDAGRRMPDAGCRTNENDIVRILLTNYNDRYTPDVKPVNVGVETFILSNPVLLNRGTSGEPMLEIDNMWIIQSWRDRRLNFETFYPERNNIRLPHEHISKVWTPQISSINDKKFEIRRSPTPNINLFIFENGTVNLSFRAAVQLPCRTDCQENEIRCRLTFQSGNYNIEEVKDFFTHSIKSAPALEKS
uniref:Neurotransmitter-gated ion-channel ligand-binding domain-containing protein n=1 Tax=Romanomermis culicivorax TaxID=13658 RepID=A0A915LE81_ROMCU